MIKISVGLEKRGLAARNQSSEAVHRIVSVCCSLDWGCTVNLLHYIDRQWPLLLVYDSNIHLAWECCRLWLVW